MASTHRGAVAAVPDRARKPESHPHRAIRVRGQARHVVHPLGRVSVRSGCRYLNEPGFPCTSVVLPPFQRFPSGVFDQRSAVVVGIRDSVRLPIAPHSCPDNLAQRSSLIRWSCARDPDSSRRRSSWMATMSAEPGRIRDQVFVHPVAQTSVTFRSRGFRHARREANQILGDGNA